MGKDKSKKKDKKQEKKEKKNKQEKKQKKEKKGKKDKKKGKPPVEGTPEENEPRPAASEQPTEPVSELNSPPWSTVNPPVNEAQPPSPQPNTKKLTKKEYEKELRRLQVELVKFQEWVKHAGLKVVVIFEGRDAAGKGGVIKRIMQPLNPRSARVVALSVPTEREKTQWYFQRYIPHLPAAGEIVLFDRSWYNRAGVERVMGFCTEEEYWEFLRSCPEFECMLIRSGIILIKYWFSVSDIEQEKTFPRPAGRPHQTLETQPDGCGSPQPLGGILQGQRRNDEIHRHQTGPLVCGQRRRQDESPSELHHPPPRPDPLRRPDPRAGGTAPTPGKRRL